MNEFYTVADFLKNQLLLDINVNTVTHESTTEIDLFKKAIYPIANVLIVSAIVQQGQLIFNWKIHVLDQRNVSKTASSDKWLRNDNELDNLNTTFAVMNRLITRLRLQRNEFDIEMVNDPSPLPVELEFLNGLDGWEMDLSLSIPNTQIVVC